MYRAEEAAAVAVRTLEYNKIKMLNTFSFKNVCLWKSILSVRSLAHAHSPSFAICNTQRKYDNEPKQKKKHTIITTATWNRTIEKLNEKKMHNYNNNSNNKNTIIINGHLAFVCRFFFLHRFDTFLCLWFKLICCCRRRHHYRRGRRSCQPRNHIVIYLQRIIIILIFFISHLFVVQCGVQFLKIIRKFLAFYSLFDCLPSAIFSLYNIQMRECMWRGVAHSCVRHF